MPAGSSAASATTKPARQVERAPDAEGGGERVAALDDAVAGAEQAERGAWARRVSMRWHDSGMPFQPRRRRPPARSCPGRRPRRSRLTPSDVWQAAYSKASELLDLVDRPQAAGRVDEEVRGVLDDARRAHQRAQRVDQEGGHLEPVAARVRLPAGDARRGRRASRPPRRGSSSSGRERSRGWSVRLRSWKRMSAHRPAAPRRPCPWHSLPTRMAGSPSGPEDEDGLLEAGVEAGQVREVGAVLAIGVDDEDGPGPRLPARSRARCEARLVQLAADRLGIRSGHAELGELDMGQSCPRSPLGTAALMDSRSRLSQALRRLAASLHGDDGSAGTVLPLALLAVRPGDADAGLRAIAQAEVDRARARRPRGRRRR